MKKDINYFMNLNYKIEITPIPEEMGGGFEASIPQLGKYAFIGYGNIIDEALKDLEETKIEYFKEFLEKGIEIPEPEKPKKEFRGDFLLRMPTYLHEDLYYTAKKNDVSINQFINYLLTKNLQTYMIGDLLTQHFQHFWDTVWLKPPSPLKIEEKYVNNFIIKREKKLIGA